MVHPEMKLMKTDISTVKCTVRRDDEAQLPHEAKLAVVQIKSYILTIGTYESTRTLEGR